jgi:hypothetical protein
VRKFVLGRVDPLSKGFNLLQLLTPQFVDFLVKCQWVPLIREDGESIINKHLMSSAPGMLSIGISATFAF